MKMKFIARSVSIGVALFTSISFRAACLAQEPSPKKEIDLQQREAALEAAKKDLAMQESGGTIMMNLQGDVLFDFDKFELRPEAKEGLDKVAAVIAAFPESNVLIEGYTDSKGSPRANLALSKKRAESVKDWLVKQKDISADIITTEGLGETKPITPNDNPEGRQKKPAGDDYC